VLEREARAFEQLAPARDEHTRRDRQRVAQAGARERAQRRWLRGLRARAGDGVGERRVERARVSPDRESGGRVTDVGRRLRSRDVLERTHGRVVAAPRAERLVRQIREHFVHVHVHADRAATTEQVGREMVAVRTGFERERRALERRREPAGREKARQLRRAAAREVGVRALERQRRVARKIDERLEQLDAFAARSLTRDSPGR